MGAILPSSLDKLEQHEVHADFNAKSLAAFVKATRDSQGAELANAQSIFREFCAALKVQPPKLKGAGDNPYCFEADVLDAGKPRRMDVYLRGHFIFEAKQGADPSAKGAPKGSKGAGVRGTDTWRQKMIAGRVQVGRYAVAATKRDNVKPPFIMLADLGYGVWIWSSWTKDAVDDYGDFEEGARFAWEDLTKPEVFRHLRLIFDKPEELNEEARGQRITAEIAAKVCDLATVLEKRSKRDVVGDFLMKCVFTMFAEDVGLLPLRMFSNLLDRWIEDKKSGKDGTFVRGLRTLWKRMDTGGDLDTGERIRQFNGYLFKEHEPLDLTIPELEALRAAARADWRKVSPAIFGTLFERAITPEERHRLGAHYTPEPYIQRLVEQTMTAPLRAEWDLVRAEMERARQTAKSVAEGRKKALKIGKDFRKRLATLRVLDPACGSGNFLYVAMRDLKRIEGEVERALVARAGYQPTFDYEHESVHPVQFHGIEVKPWAAKIAELVLWIGYFQWQTSAGRLGWTPEPLIKDLHHIEARDALLTWTRRESLKNDRGKAVTRWDGATTKAHAQTGEQVPDEAAQTTVYRYVGVKPASWPDADFIIGNPPFLGTRRMRLTLGDGYVDALVSAFPEVPENADFVMYWWHRAADLVRAGKVRRFGLITTNSITQTFNRAVVQNHLDAESPLSIAFAVPDHPWIDSGNGAAVRIAMTVGVQGDASGMRSTVVSEVPVAGGHGEQSVTLSAPRTGRVGPDLRVGASPASARPLKANEGVCFWGVKFYGNGFVVTPAEAAALAKRQKGRSLARLFVSGRDLTGTPRGMLALDCNDLVEETLADKYGATYEWLLERVKPVRDHNPRAFKRERWWIFGENQPGMRRAVAPLARFIATTETAKHRVFRMLDKSVLAEGTVNVIAIDDDFILGVLSSRVHVAWALAAGGRLGVGNDPRYNNTRCFDPFPFPVVTKAARDRIADIAKRFEAHRADRMSEHDDLTVTGIYNVLEKIRAGQTLTADEGTVKSHAQVSTLRKLHDDLDAAVIDAYGWPAEVTDDDILTRLVELNAQRAAEEEKGKVRWLRPEFQAPDEVAQTPALPTTTPKGPKPKVAKAAARPKWPKADPPKYAVVLDVLASLDGSAPLDDILGAIDGPDTNDVVNVLACLAAAQRTAFVDDGDGPRWILRA